MYSKESTLNTLIKTSIKWWFQRRPFIAHLIPNYNALQNPNKTSLVCFICFSPAAKVILQRWPSCLILTLLQFNYELWHQGVVPMTSADENRNRQLVLLNTFVSPCEPQQLHYMESRSQIDGAGGWHCLTVHTRKIYFHRWSHKSKGKVQRWCKQRIVAHLFHRYWQMPKQ